MRHLLKRHRSYASNKIWNHTYSCFPHFWDLSIFIKNMFRKVHNRDLSYRNNTRNSFYFVWKLVYDFPMVYKKYMGLLTKKNWRGLQNRVLQKIFSHSHPLGSCLSIKNTSGVIDFKKKFEKLKMRTHPPPKKREKQKNDLKLAVNVMPKNLNMVKHVEQSRTHPLVRQR